MKSSLQALCLGFLCAHTLSTEGALAAAPTAKECVEASTRSVQLDNENLLLEERAALLLCASDSCPALIRTECLERAEAVIAAIPTILFELRDASGQDVSAVQMTLDGSVVEKPREGTALEVNPGAHTFTFKLADGTMLEKKFILQASQKNRHEVITVETKAPSAVAPAPALAREPDAATESRGKGLGAQRIAAIVTGGVGVVGLVVGGVFGATAMSRKSDAEDACPGGTCNTKAGSNLWDDARSAGNISTVAFLVGGVAAATGAVLWFTASPRTETAQTFVGIGPGTVQLKGRF